MPPKVKKRSSTRSISKRSKNSIAEAQVTESTKSNYRIFILNIETTGVQSILKEFIALAKSRKRLVVVPIVLDEILQEISLEKAKAQRRSSELLSSPEDTEVRRTTTPLLATSDEIFENLKIKITKCIEEHDSILAGLNSIKTVDLLEYWQETIKTQGKSGIGGKDIKNKKSAAGAKEAKAKGKDEKGVQGVKRKSAKEMQSDYGDEICQLGTLPSIELSSKKVSQFFSGTRDIKISQDFVLDHPQDGPALYIILIGSVSSELFLKLVRENYPIAANISVCPKLRDESIPSVSDALALLDETKPIGLYNVTFPIMSKCDAFVYKDQIYDQLCWLLYDVETTRRQHVNYIAHLKDIDVSMKESSSLPTDDILTRTFIPDSLDDSSMINLYLDCLLNAVSNALDELPIEAPIDNSRYASQYPVCFEVEGKVIVEYKNKIARRIFSKNKDDISVYPKCIEQITNYGLTRFIWNEAHSGTHFPQTPVKASIDTASKFGSISSLFQNEDPVYVEILTKDAVAQRLADLSASYDRRVAEFVIARDEVEVLFLNSNEQYNEASTTVSIPTKLCFRDYCKYVADEIQDWTKGQEAMYERQLTTRIEALKNLRSLKFDDIVEKDFIFDSSLKNVSNHRNSENIASKDADNENKQMKLRSIVVESQVIHETDQGNLQHAPNPNIPSFAYNIGDTRFQIICTKAVFRSRTGSLQLLEDRYADNSVLLRADFNCLGNHFLYSHTNPKRYDPPFMKIICADSSEINIQLVPTATPIPNLASAPETSQTQPAAPETSGPQTYFNLYIVWPNRLEIRTIYNEATGQLICIEQLPKHSESAQLKRLYYPTGIVAIYYNDGSVDILTPSGLVYETVNAEDAILELYSTQSNLEHEGVELDPEIFKFEMETFDQLQCEIFKEKYKFIRPDGQVYETFAGRVVQANRKLHLTEWYDYALGEAYSMQEGGIKTKLANNCYDVYYPNGTLITTKLNDYVMEENIMPESESTVRIVPHVDNTTGQSGVRITENILEELVDEAVSDRNFVACNRTFLIQDENYASVRFEKDQIKISCPHKTDIILLRNNELEINIKEEFVVNCNPRQCIVRSSQYQVPNSSAEAVFNFNPNVEPFLHLKSGDDSELKVNQNGKRQYNILTQTCRPKFITPTERRIVIDSNLEGYEIRYQSEVEDIMACLEGSENIVSKTSELIVILEPLETYQKQFKMPIPGFEKFIKKFIQKGRPCEAVVKPTIDPLKKISDMLTVRTFLLAIQYFRRKHPSIAPIFSDCLLTVDDVHIYQDSVDSVPVLLRQEATRAIENYLYKMRAMPLRLVTNMCSSSNTSVKNQALMEKITEDKRRLKIYKNILKCNFTPKYADFWEAGGKVKDMDVFKYEHDLNVLAGQRLNTSLGTNLTLRNREGPSNEKP